MNTNTVQTAVIPGAIAAAAILLSVSLPFNAVTMIGFAAFVGIVGIAALEYRVSLKRLLNR